MLWMNTEWRGGSRIPPSSDWRFAACDQSWLQLCIFTALY